MQLFPDHTIFIQVGLFILFWVVFKHVVVGPMSAALAEREQRTAQAEQDAKAQAAATAETQARYEERVHEQRLHMAQEAEAARRAAIEAANEEIAAARARIAHDLAHRRAQIAAQIAEARRALGSEANVIAGDMLDRVGGGRHS
jgi:F0F1-type ATP synthase membrane subunit b/b'